MNKRYALVFALLITGLIFSNIFLIKFVSTKNNSNRESVVISRIIDGDTIELLDGRTLRLLNINSPEKGTISANLSTEFLKSFENKTIWIEITGADKYKRNLARLYSQEYLNLKIVELGLASKFLVQDEELSDFSRAEENAIKNNLGIWKKSKFSDCFQSKINPENEIVILKNNCFQINMEGWFLKDESRKIYKFNNISFKEIKLNSFYGEDNLTDLFWKSKDNIWNNDRDTLYLFDNQGGISHHETYGY